MFLHHLPRHPLPYALPVVCPRCRLPPRCDLDPQTRRFLHQRRDAQPAPEWPTAMNPTPYDVLGIPRDAPYTKTRFYQLAKLYHPDRHHTHTHTSPHLTRAVCTERYRLVVRANDILSDPAKRLAYDAHGDGWAAAKPLTRDTYRKWRADQASAARNATWEDWERWHDARRGKTQEPVYMSHGSFFALLALALSIGIVGQANRAEAMSNNRARLMEDRQSRMLEGMDKRASASAGLGKAERVEWFARDRENTAWGFAPQKWEADKLKEGRPPPEPGQQDRA